jgi:hypothetical protein
LSSTCVEKELFDSSTAEKAPAAPAPTIEKRNVANIESNKDPLLTANLLSGESFLRKGKSFCEAPNYFSLFLFSKYSELNKWNYI